MRSAAVSSRGGLPSLLAVLLWMAGMARAADAPPGETAQRERLGAERAAAQARYDHTVAACEQAFVVTPCISRAKAERRATLDRLTREQTTLDDAARRRRAEERRRRIAAKQQAVVARAASTPEAPAVREPKPAAPAASPVRPRHKAEPRSDEEAAALDAEAAARAAKARERGDTARARAETVRQRNAQRALQKPPAAPLPAPASAAGR
ncbi:MAG: hypothetical protein IT390_20930 [Nitrospira sp.]|nr:hypothetical protein [Nitrospira sp.]